MIHTRKYPQEVLCNVHHYRYRSSTTTLFFYQPSKRMLEIYSILVHMNKTVTRFLKYFSVGFSTFLFDLALLYVFTDFLHINYIVSTGLAYAIAVSCNYYLSRTYVFSKTLRRTDHGYYMFMCISGVGVLFVMLSMSLLVEVFHFEYMLSRVLVAGIVGIWNYLMNLFVNFKVANIH